MTKTRQLITALEKTDYHRMKELVEEGIDVNALLLPSHATILHHAVCAQNLESIKFLVGKLHCNPNTLDHDGNTALHWLFTNQRGIYAIDNLLSVTQFFAKNRMDITIKDRHGWTALDCAIYYYGSYYSRCPQSKEMLDKIFAILIVAILSKNPTQAEPNTIQEHKPILNIWKEFNRLQEEKIKKSSLSYLVTKKPEMIATRLSVGQCLESLDYIKNEFPIIHNGLVKHKTPRIERELKERSSLLCKLKNSVFSTENDISKKLDSDSLDEILSFLHNSDLKGGIKAFIFDKNTGKKKENLI
ncbi:ankyrin repeat domain-containing protein [Rickettsiella endosymbiont of Dermanyssus gallinae]|uniref:ankyrin repeat domain-containing protein n=1 Tax=Rickettsiella endosymbiont of Dermanyssus gallinae TaxID=2856608 RepID=UPI001C533870|nr:ankyrin repeat domain-containing protein [Rickettsiella endosymbiont of Dermanyssus gallinae]